MRKIKILLMPMVLCFYRFKRYCAKMIWRGKNKRLYNAVKLTKEQQNDVRTLWRDNGGRKADLTWHRFYQSFVQQYGGTGFDKYYFPEDVFNNHLMGVLTPLYAMPYGIKGMEQYFLHDAEVITPENVLYNYNGYFYNNQRALITKEEAVHILKNSGKIVAKYVNSSGGRDIAFYDCGPDTAENAAGQALAEQIIHTFQKDFVIQKEISPHPSLSKIYAGSINTIRIITYILDGQIHITPMILRVGQGNSRVDNLVHGGLSIGLSEDGVLHEAGFTKTQKMYRTHPDSGVVFKGYRIPRVPEMIALAKRNHSKIPFAGIVGWDYTLDANGDIVVIEFNLHPGIQVMQYHGKSLFGENTPKMIALCAKTKNRAERKRI